MIARIRLALVVLTLSLSFAAFPAGDLEAQRANGVELTPYAGLMIFDNLVDGPLGTSLGSATGAVFGVQLGLPLLPGVKVVGHVAHASGSLEVGLPVVGGLGVGDSRALLYDAGLQLGIPRDRGAAPFLQVGAGGIRQEFEVSGVSTDATSFAVHAGLGVDIPLGGAAGLRLMARDYIGRFDFQEAVLVDVDDEIRHNVAVTAGLRLSF